MKVIIGVVIVQINVELNVEVVMTENATLVFDFVCCDGIPFKILKLHSCCRTDYIHIIDFV
jgi:hypothetical protein